MSKKLITAALGILISSTIAASAATYPTAKHPRAQQDFATMFFHDRLTNGN